MLWSVAFTFPFVIMEIICCTLLAFMFHFVGYFYHFHKKYFNVNVEADCLVAWRQAPFSLDGRPILDWSQFINIVRSQLLPSVFWYHSVACTSHQRLNMKNILLKHKVRKTCSKTIKELSNKVLFNLHRVYNDDNTFYYLHCLTSLNVIS